MFILSNLIITAVDVDLPYSVSLKLTENMCILHFIHLSVEKDGCFHILALMEVVSLKIY